MTWDTTVDVVVVGFGGAGAVAALEARESGVDVLVADARLGGGATTISGGVVYAGGGTSIQREAGVEDSPDAMYDYLRFEVGDSVRPETLRRFVDESIDNLDWLIRHGVPFEGSVCPHKTSFPTDDYYLYYSGSEASGAARKVAAPAQRGHRAKGKGTSGKMIFGPLARAVRRAGVRVLTQTSVTALVTDDEGRVVGVEARSLADAPARVRSRHARLCRISAKPGIYAPALRAVLEKRIRRIERRYATPIRIRARRAVVLTTGGFIANRALVHRHAPDFTGGISLGTATDDGAGIAMAAALGATTTGMGNVSAWRFISPPSALLGSLLVDRHGRRIVDESRYGAALGEALVRDADRQGWLVADAELVREAKAQLKSQSLWFQRIQATGLLRTAIRADTLDVLAGKAGIDPAGLRATVDAANAAVDGAGPDPMGKHPDFARALRTPPYSLFDVGIKPNAMNPCPMLTLGGLRVDENTGAVLDESDAAIAGLYAAGRVAAGVCTNSYVSGLSIADCVFAGRRAGKQAAQDVPAPGLRSVRS
ncbi:FAD-binding protein [Rhodococcus triatomae]|uniref:3-oxo-5alpha-steroid 4-dehydrogenase n=1 Tax=Rhodococcus triatomae TaxID=300028 RepID=A0A1G8BC66_9NOCA|nr:FAD-binding protein [Rhodococcus triatomae]QNG17439.1 FAD-binding protein [Rhodococcus triatomae]QNG22893.1 FAD-binding protein [Rhodococcus triatomae]SDH30768.1 3-oxo-5alpha-steroid 4-dehydrogenase [Rhodococcus triatomae]